MSGRGLDVLIRLARQRRDAERQALGVTTEAIGWLERQAGELRARRDEERRLAAEGGPAGPTQAPYLERLRRREAEIAAALTRLEDERAAGLQRLTEARVEQRRLEILDERRRQRADAARDRAEARILDDLVLARWRQSG